MGNFATAYNAGFELVHDIVVICQGIYQHYNTGHPEAPNTRCEIHNKLTSLLN